jgi:hypothetical protein
MGVALMSIIDLSSLQKCFVKTSKEKIKIIDVTTSGVTTQGTAFATIVASIEDLHSFWCPTSRTPSGRCHVPRSSCAPHPIYRLCPGAWSDRPYLDRHPPRAVPLPMKYDCFDRIENARLREDEEARGGKLLPHRHLASRNYPLKPLSHIWHVPMSFGRAACWSGMRVSTRGQNQALVDFLPSARAMPTCAGRRRRTYSLGGTARRRVTIPRQNRSMFPS